MSGGGRIAELVARMERMGSDQWRAELSAKLAQATLKLIDQTFTSEKSPYGDAWRARKGKYSWPMLQKTRAMRFNFRVAQADSRGFNIWNQREYASFQQYGTSKGIDPREMVPIEAFGLPASWRREYERIAADSIRRLMRGQ